MKIAYYTTSCCLLLLFAIAGMLSSCKAFELVKPQYGIVPVPLNDGGKLYFRREVRGLSHDELSLSADPVRCRSAKPEDDYIFQAQGPLTVFTLSVWGPK